MNDGTVVKLGGDHLDSRRLRPARPRLRSEGQLGIVTEASVRILRAAEGARRSSSASRRSRMRAIASPRSSRPASSPSPSSTWTSTQSSSRRISPRPAIHATPRRCSSSRSRAPRPSATRCSGGRGHRRRLPADQRPRLPLRAESAAIWKAASPPFGATGRISDYICMDGTIPTGQLGPVLERIESICAGHGLRVANVFHAGDGNLHPADPVRYQQAGRIAEGRGRGRRDPQALRRSRRLPHRRARALASRSGTSCASSTRRRTWNSRCG